MADQDWKTGGLNRRKYFIRKKCEVCAGNGCDECENCGSVEIDKGAAYFVLRIDGNCDPHARAALQHYAKSVESDNPLFAQHIREWLDEV